MLNKKSVISLFARGQVDIFDINRFKKYASSVFWVGITEATIVVINGVIALFLAHRFRPEMFSQYIVITTAVTSLARITRGIQSSVAHKIAPDTNLLIGIGRSGQGGIGISLKLGITLCTIWVAISPIFSLITHISLIPILAATPIIFGSTLGSLVSGYLQGSSKFHILRISILLSTSVQLPIVITLALLKAPISAFILSLCVPSVLYATVFIRSKHFRKIVADVEITLGLLSGFLLLILTFGLQMPLIFARNELNDSEIGPITFLLFTLGVMVSVSSNLGSYLLPGYKATKPHKTLFHMQFRHGVHAILIPFFACFYILLHLSPFRAFIGSDYFYDAIPSYFYYCIFSYTIWSLLKSVVEERLAHLSLNSVLIASTLAACELSVLYFANLNLSSYFVIHAIVGLCNLLAMLLTAK